MIINDIFLGETEQDLSKQIASGQYSNVAYNYDDKEKSTVVNSGEIDDNDYKIPVGLVVPSHIVLVMI